MNHKYRVGKRCARVRNSPPQNVLVIVFFSRAAEFAMSSEASEGKFASLGARRARAEINDRRMVTIDTPPRRNANRIEAGRSSRSA